jgi:hypothetical protein
MRPMKHRLAALALGLAVLPLPLAAETAAPERTIASYQAMSVEERRVYLAGLADMLDSAAALAPDNSRLPLLAECTQGFGDDELLSALEAGANETRSEWAPDASAAVWFVDTMIYVCQLQLQPLQH